MLLILHTPPHCNKSIHPTVGLQLCLGQSLTDGHQRVSCGTCMIVKGRYGHLNNDCGLSGTTVTTVFVVPG